MDKKIQSLVTRYQELLEEMQDAASDVTIAGHEATKIGKELKLDMCNLQDAVKHSSITGSFIYDAITDIEGG